MKSIESDGKGGERLGNSKEVEGRDGKCMEKMRRDGKVRNG